MSQNGAGGPYLGNGIPTTLGHGINPNHTYDDWFAVHYMPVDEFRESMRELKRSIDALTGRVGIMNDNAIEARSEHAEMRRQLDEHEMQLHGKTGEPGLVIKVDRLEQSANGWTQWIGYFGAAGLVGLAWLLSHLWK